jgi:hypothetical protein
VYVIPSVLRSWYNNLKLARTRLHTALRNSPYSYAYGPNIIWSVLRPGNVVEIV